MAVQDFKIKNMITIISFILAGIFALFSYICFKAANRYLKYPFQNWEKSDIPYITIDIQGHQLNMIADSGGSMCIIRKDVLNEIDYKPSTRTVEICALTNEGLPSEVVTVPIIINEKEFDIDFIVYNSDDIGGFKYKCGVEMHGLLGVEFFKATGGIVDFNTKTVKFP